MSKLSEPCPVQWRGGRHEVYRIKGGNDAHYRLVCRACMAGEDESAVETKTDEEKIDTKDVIIVDAYLRARNLITHAVGLKVRDSDLESLVAFTDQEDVRKIVVRYEQLMSNAHSQSTQATQPDPKKSAEQSIQIVKYAKAAIEWRHKAEVLELENRHMRERLKSVMKEALHALYTGNVKEAMSILEVYSSREALNDDSDG